MDFKREWYVGFNKDDGRIGKITQSVNRQDIERYRWRNPDLLCIDKKRGLIIIEIDGSIHDIKTEKTIRRNREYESANVKFGVVSLSELKFYKKTIEEEIDCVLKKLCF